MLSRPLLNAKKSNILKAAASAAVPAVKKTNTTTNYPVVKFVSEDIQTISNDIPQFSYYQMPLDKHRTSPFVDLSSPLSEKIVEIDETKPYDPTSKLNTLQFSQLENNLKIVTIDNGNEASSLGLFVNAGSRFETPSNAGAGHMLECMAFRSTAHLSALRIAKTLEALGVEAKCDANREYIAYHCSCLRGFIPYVVPMMVGNVLYPRLVRWEVGAAEAKVSHYQEILKQDVDEYVSELLHEAAYHNNTLGNAVLATEANKAHMNEHVLRNYILEHFSPENMTFVGINVSHSEIEKWLMRSFCDYNAVPNGNDIRAVNPGMQKPNYTGGYRYIKGDETATCHVGIAFNHEGGWNAGSNGGIAVGVFKELLGCTGSIATGTSNCRINKIIGQECGYVHEATTFNRSYSDTGLFGVYGVIDAVNTNDYLQTLAKVFHTPITKEEVTRAKNQLKKSVAFGANSGEDLAIDLGSQMVMTGKALSTVELCAKIDAITEADVKNVQSSLLKTKCTAVCNGNIGYMPHYDVVCRILSGGGNK